MSYMVKVFRGFVKGISGLNSKNKQRCLSSYSFFRFVLVLALTQTILVEAIQRESLLNAFTWLSANLSVFLINYFLTILVCLFFISLTGSLHPVMVFSSLFLVLLSLTSLVKKQFLGDPLFPWDFSRLDQVVNLLPQYSGEILISLIFAGLLVLGLFLVGKLFIPGYKAGWKIRSILLIGLAIMAPLLIYYRHTPLQAVLIKSNVEHISWVQSENSLKNGFLLGFMMNMENTMIFQPDGYNSTEIGKIVEENLPSSAVMAGTVPNQPVIKPNIVFVLNESFWDPTVLSNVRYSADPVPFFRNLRENQYAGTMISPVFGGSTANVEFEILTGLSTSFLPQGAIAYQQYIEKPIPSIPRLFKENGYITTAIHPYHAWFYKRDKVYPFLGFDHFYSLHDFKDAEIKGEYISDLEVSKMISSQVQATPEPAFIFAVTMQNHGPYPANRYLQNDIAVEGTLSPEGKGILETYAQGLRDADDALQYLIQELSQIEEPTAVVFMGDHLPYLGKDYLTYKETGYLAESENKWSLADTFKMRSVPFVIWSNYGANVENHAAVSAQFLGHYLLDLAEIQDDFISNFTRDFAQQLPVFGKTVNMNKEGDSFRQLPDYFIKLKKDYWLLQYDILFGQQYYKDYSKK